MPFLNKVLMMGHLVRDPEHKSTQGGSLAKFSIAINNRKKDGGEFVDDPVFLDCTVWGDKADALCDRARKGDPLFIEGKLIREQWDAKDGSGKREKISCTVFQFQVLPRAGKSDEPQDNEGAGKIPF